jgi:hypothetical protein
VNYYPTTAAADTAVEFVVPDADCSSFAVAGN